MAINYRPAPPLAKSPCSYRVSLSVDAEVNEGDVISFTADTAYSGVIAYGGRTSRIGQADLLGSRARDYLVTQRGIDQSRIVVLNGGFREEDCVELWIIPRGATPPVPTPTVQAGDVRPASPRRGSRRRR